MKYTIRNKFMTIGGSSTVLDENGVEVFKVKGKIISPTKKKKIFDMEKKLHYIVRNQYWSTTWKRKAFIFNADKEKMGTIHTNVANVKFGLEDFVDDYAIEREQSEGLKLESTWLIKKQGVTVAKYQSKLLRAIDEFSLETLTDDVDVAFLVAMLIAIDNLKDIKNEEREENANFDITDFLKDRK